MFAFCSSVYHRQVRPHCPDSLQESNVVSKPATVVWRVLAFAACAAFAEGAMERTGTKAYVGVVSGAPCLVASGAVDIVGTCVVVVLVGRVASAAAALVAD